MSAMLQLLSVAALGLLAVASGASPENAKDQMDDSMKAIEDSLEESSEETVKMLAKSKDSAKQEVKMLSKGNADQHAMQQQIFQNALEEQGGFEYKRMQEHHFKSVAMHLAHMGSEDALKPLVDTSKEAVNRFEMDVTSMVLGLSKGGGLATPMGSSIGKIKKLIEDEMMKNVLNGHKADQTLLDKLAKDLDQCGKTKDVNVLGAKRQQRAYKTASPLHKTCRTGEASLYQENLACHEEWKDKKQVKELKCKYYSMVSGKTGNQNANKNIMSKAGGESVVTYVTRISATVCGTPRKPGNGGHNHKGLLDQLLDAKDACERATLHFNKITKKCNNLDKQWHDQKMKCNNIQDSMDNAACDYAVETKDACETYAECYKTKRGDYDKAEKKIRQKPEKSQGKVGEKGYKAAVPAGQEEDRKAEWKGLKRMHCLITGFEDGKMEESEVKACKEKTHTTTHLDIKYPKVNDMAKCEVPDLYPTTAKYKAAEFTPLPVLAKGKVDANECTGVSEISTEPKAGSPSSCKCDRVTLNGPYSPGPMVKCSNCLDIRRTADKSSCPEGTKLFAPRSRSDWDTFLKSADPLRAPHWIIDVTRPQNGCGGCTRYSMSSSTTQQSSWVTQDQSPWWLRSTTYSEPNGDYHSNCFLDLWHTPKDANSVTWNDGNCNYHSKSYYCQALTISTNPKPGSPTGCLCKKVELNGAYTAGLLLKCSGCLDVRRANDKNSCPSGTKIFAPKSRVDWKTFIDSATPLRNPHWIIDVTRPQNGCGGCTRHPMNSQQAAQATWRTSDNSPWWLRSTRYGEPNGDYSANCYLDLWHAPGNEDTVTFNDGRCNYHSKSYYCQSARGAKKMGSVTTKAPWAETRR